jgi:hypothetical protein
VSSGQSSWLHNGDVLCFLWGTNWIYICYIEESKPPLWYSGQSSWLQNGEELCFLWGTNWIYICYIEESRPPLWSSGQSSWLQNGVELCFLWGTNWIYICYIDESRPPLWSSGQSSWLKKGDVSYFLWGTNWIHICCVEESRPPLWSSGQSSWLQIQRSGFDSRLYQVFWEAVGLERGPFSLVSTTEELREWKSSDCGRRLPIHIVIGLPHDAFGIEAIKRGMIGSKLKNMKGFSRKRPWCNREPRNLPRSTEDNHDNLTHELQPSTFPIQVKIVILEQPVLHLRIGVRFSAEARCSFFCP